MSTDLPENVSKKKQGRVYDINHFFLIEKWRFETGPWLPYQGFTWGDGVAWPWCNAFNNFYLKSEHKG